MKRILALSTALAVWTGCLADSWSLDSCINYAIEHNITVKSRKLDTRSAELAVTEAKDAFLPQVQGSASQSFSFGRGLTSENTYADRNTSQFGWNIGMSLPLFQGLSAKRRLDYSRANLQAIAEQCEVAKDNVELQVISQYLQVLYCGEMLDVAMEQERLSRVQLDRCKVLVEEGKTPELELTQAEAQVAQNHLSVVNAENDRMLALLDLSQLLQLPTMDGFDVQPLSETASLLPDASEVYDNALRNNHAIKAGRLALTAAEKNISVARTGYIPRLSFTAGIGSSYYNLSGAQNPPFHRQMRDNLSKSLGFSLSIPIFDAFSTRNSVRRAKIQHTSAMLSLEDAQSNLYKSINQAYRQAMASESKHEAALVAEKSTKAAYEAMEVKYEFGRANSTELEQSRSEYIRARMQTVQSRYETLLRMRILSFYNRTE